MEKPVGDKRSEPRRRSAVDRSGDSSVSVGGRDRPAPRATQRWEPAPGADLPRWVTEALTRVTPEGRVADALRELGAATDAFGDGAYAVALRHAAKAKELSPRDASVREILALSAYRLGDWKTALRELRTFRRLTGDLTHLPVELDTLRAMGRAADAGELWHRIEGLDDEPAIQKEGAVVYGSMLIDEDRIDEARAVLSSAALTNNPHPEDLRLWYVAARAAALAGNSDEAALFRDAVVAMDPGFPGLDELDAAIATTSGSG